MRIRMLVCALAAACLVNAQVVDLAGEAVDPFTLPARARVFLFVRTDCPITNRYAPELQRISAEFSNRGAVFWLVYPDRSEKLADIAAQIREYVLPGRPVRDPDHKLVKRAQATVAPEAAVFDEAGHLLYVGRIDDRYVSVGKSRIAPGTHDLEAAITAVLAGKPVAQARTQATGCYLADVQ